MMSCGETKMQVLGSCRTKYPLSDQKHKTRATRPETTLAMKKWCEHMDWERWKNGEIFIDTCALNKLAIGGSIFPNKRLLMATWVPPEHATANQINHICISKKFRRSLQDVQVKRGADVASDPHLLIVKLKLKKNWMETRAKRQQYNVGLQRDILVWEEYRLKPYNKSQILQELQELLEDEATM